MVEWAEGEEDPDSYEIPKLDQDLPECLRGRAPAESPQSLEWGIHLAPPRGRGARNWQSMRIGHKTDETNHGNGTRVFC